MFSLPKDSVIFAPLEGYTDAAYRSVVSKLYPEYDYYFSDFLRVPSNGVYPDRIIKEHCGEITPKTVIQILASERGDVATITKQISNVGAHWLDLNLGCPSKSVISHGGGAYLLAHPDKLLPIVRSIRSNFKGIFSCKIRVGLNDDHHFKNIISLLEEEGVDAITIHARLRSELYKGHANWQYIASAKEHITLPIIGSGDIWSYEDFKNRVEQTKCDAIMCARGALKTPWLGRLIKEKRQESEDERKSEIIRYLTAMNSCFIKTITKEEHQLKRLKSLCYFLFEPISGGSELRRELMHTQHVDQFENNLIRLLK